MSRVPRQAGSGGGANQLYAVFQVMLSEKKNDTQTYQGEVREWEGCLCEGGGPGGVAVVNSATANPTSNSWRSQFHRMKQESHNRDKVFVSLFLQHSSSQRSPVLPSLPPSLPSICLGLAHLPGAHSSCWVFFSDRTVKAPLQRAGSPDEPKSLVFFFDKKNTR